MEKGNVVDFLVYHEDASRPNLSAEIHDNISDELKAAIEGLITRLRENRPI